MTKQCRVMSVGFSTIPQRSHGSSPQFVLNVWERRGHYGASTAWVTKPCGLARSRRLTSARLEHDPEKWTPVFEKDHAPTISWSGMTIRRIVIPL